MKNFCRLWVALLLILTFWVPELGIANSEALTATQDAPPPMDPAQALKLLEDAYAKNPKDFSVICQLTGLYLAVGDVQADESGKSTYYEKSRTMAVQAIAISPDRVEGYLGRAAALGKLAPLVNTRTSRKYIAQVRQDATKAIDLSADGTPTKAMGYFVLGSLHLEVSVTSSRLIRVLGGIGWAKLSEAEKYLGKAVESDPTSIQYRLEFGKALVRARKKTEAAEQWNTALSLAPRDPADVGRIAEIHQRLAELEGN